MPRHKFLHAAFLILLFIIAAALPARAATPDQVEKAIGVLRDSLYSTEANGNWDPPIGDNEVRGKDQHGGVTALATLALLSASESPHDPRIAAALNRLKGEEMTGTYALAMRLQVWNLVFKSGDYRAAAIHDAKQLINNQRTSGPGVGMWDYFNPGPYGADRYDHSNSQYALLGLWAAAEMGIEIPDKVWEASEAAWRKQQYADGGWCYRESADENDKRATVQMTEAGVASLYVIQEFFGAKDVSCKGNIVDPQIDKGLAWIGSHAQDLLTNGNSLWHPYYGFYGMERCGVASGRKYFGDVDWFKLSSDYICAHTGDATMGGVRGTILTSYALLTLVRGRAPIAINKLEYFVGTGDGVKPGNWNERPRDVAYFTKWLGASLERPLNWQIVNLTRPVAELHDAPILFIAGNEALNFNDEGIIKLRQFVQEGGLIVGNADCGDKRFADSFKKLGHALFPDYEFRNLESDNIILAGEQFKPKQWSSHPGALTLSNGARELMLMFPTGDPARWWYTQNFMGHREMAEIMANVFFYSNREADLAYKGETYIVARDDAGHPSRTIKVARIQYNGNWDPEPAGWSRLNNILHNASAADLDISNVKLGDGKLDNSYKIADMTGTATFRLTDAQQQELKKFVDGGGTIIADSCGGGGDFTTSAERELSAAMGVKPDAFTILPPDHSALKALPSTTPIKYRAAARRTVGHSNTPRIRGLQVNNRMAVLLSGEDLSVGLVGNPVDGINGYDSATAATLMGSMLIYANGN